MSTGTTFPYDGGYVDGSYDSPYVVTASSRLVGQAPCHFEEVDMKSPGNVWVEIPHATEQGWSLLLANGSQVKQSRQWLVAVQVVGLVGIVLAVLSMLKAMHRNRQALWHLLGASTGIRSDSLQEKLLEVKVGHLRALLQFCCYFLVPITAWMPFWQTDLERGMIVSVAQVLLSLVALAPKLVSPRSFDAVYCVAVTLLSLTVTPWTCCDDWHQLMPVLGLANGVMLALVAVRRTMPGCLPVLLATNLLFGAATSSVILLRGEYTFHGWRWHFAAGQLLLVLLMTAAAPVLERRCCLWMYQLLELEELQEAFAASQSLLRSCFDVIVELEEAGGVVSTGPELGALLLRESARQCMAGTSFLELLEDEEERGEFKRRLACSTARELGLAESMQVSVRDACNNLLRLEAMWYEHRRLGGGGKRYMLGLREAPEQSQPQHRVEAIVVHEDCGVPEDASVSSGSSLVEGAAVLVVDVAAQGWPVKEVTPSFRARVGRLRRNTELLKVVAKPEKLHRWLVKALGGNEEQQHCRVTLKMPQGRLRAFCRLADGGGDLESVSLQFNVRGEEGDEEGRAVLHRGTSPRGSTCSLESGEQSGDDDAPLAGSVLLLNFAAEGWPVLKVMPGFQASVGRLRRRTDFRNVVSRPESFHRWLCKALEAVSSSQEPPADCELTLKMPMGRVALRFHIEGTSEDSWAADQKRRLDWQRCSL